MLHNRGHARNKVGVCVGGEEGGRSQSFAFSMLYTEVEDNVGGQLISRHTNLRLTCLSRP